MRRTIEAAIRAGVGWLTLYAFSSENWSRPQSEVTDLTGLLRHYIRQELNELKAQGVRMRILGDRTRFDADICASLDHAERETAANGRLNLNVALSYGARSEIVAAARQAAVAARDGTLDPAQLDEAMFAGMLSTAGMPDPDLVIRTSGEHRPQQLSSVAIRLRRAGVHRCAVAGFWPGGVRRRLGGVQPAGTGGSGPALADPKRGARWADLRLRVLSASVLAPVVLLCAWFGGPALAVLLILGFAGVAWEWADMCHRRPLPLVAGVVYAAAGLVALWQVRADFGPRGLFFLLVVVWCSDIGAYAAGRFLGGPRLAPSISPGKTWSGAGGGLVAAMAGGIVIAGSGMGAALGAAVLCVASQLGDLGESALKRHYGVKDSGRLIPGHGGMLDRLDGLLAAALVAGVALLCFGAGLAGR